MPFLLPQALYVRRTAPRFADAAGPDSGSVGSGPDRSLLAFGDSIIAGVGARRLSAALVGQTAAALADILAYRINWTAHGYTGADSQKLLDDHLPQLGDLTADLFITSLGVNDVTSLTPLPRWRANLDRLFERLLGSNPEALVAFAGLPPLGSFPLLPQPLRAVLGSRAAELDLAAREVIAGWPQVIHVPVDFETAPDRFAADGYHPSEASYAVFGAAMAEAIAARAGRL